MNCCEMCFVLFCSALLGFVLSHCLVLSPVLHCFLLHCLLLCSVKFCIVPLYRVFSCSAVLSAELCFVVLLFSMFSSVFYFVLFCAAVFCYITFYLRSVLFCSPLCYSTVLCCDVHSSMRCNLFSLCCFVLFLCPALL